MLRSIFSQILMVLSLLMGTAVAKADFKGFVEIGPQKALYTEVITGAPGRPTIVLLNGLTYDTRYWAPFVEALRPYGYSILMYDPVGMGRTLIRAGSADAVIPIEQQADDLNELTLRLGLRGKLHLLGLSYGGGLAGVFAQRYPQRTANAIMVAPYTQPLTQQDLWIRTQIQATRMTFPLNPASFDELYAFFLWQNVATSYHILEPSILDFPLKKRGVFQLVQGIRKYDFQKVAKAIPPRSLHLVIAQMDEYVAGGALDRFWLEVTPAARASKVVFRSTRHKIPEENPAALARWTDQILRGNMVLFGGASFDFDPSTSEVRGANGRFRF